MIQFLKLFPLIIKQNHTKNKVPYLIIFYSKLLNTVFDTALYLFHWTIHNSTSTLHWIHTPTWDWLYFITVGTVTCMTHEFQAHRSPVEIPFVYISCLHLRISCYMSSRHISCSHEQLGVGYTMWFVHIYKNTVLLCCCFLYLDKKI